MAEGCEIAMKNSYKDGSTISGVCVFIYTNDYGQITGLAEDLGSEAKPGDGLRFRDPNAGRVGAYYIHWTLKQTDGTATPQWNGRWAKSGEHITSEQIRVPKVNLNTANATEIESLHEIGRKRTGDLLSAREAKPFETEQQVALVVGDKTLQAIRESIHF